MKQSTSIQLILFMLFVGLTTIACEEEEVIGVACITYEDCVFGQQCIDGSCQDVADTGDTTGDTGNSADSVDTGNSADSANTGNSVDDSDTANSGNSVDDSDTGNTGNSVDDGDTADSGDSVDDSDTGNSVDDNDTADSVDDGDSANTGDSADDADSADTGATCGNSVIETGEACELSDTKNCTLIAAGGYSGGLATCATNCLSWNVTNCTCPLGTEKNGDGICEVLCGNGTVDGDEACEPSDTVECTTFTGAGFESGTATCQSDCEAWNKTSCVCPDDKVIDGDGNCVENNECTLGTDTCDSNATCTDTPDSFTCACNDYYDGDGATCALCNTDGQCKADCSACDVSTPKCKVNGATTTCVECLTTAECTAPNICLADNTCGYAPADHNYANESNRDIDDLATITSTITVPDTYTINSLNLRVKINNWQYDYKITLDPPHGSPVMVFNTTSSSGYLDININPADFNGQEVNGVWTLTVQDEASDDSGTMDYWRMTINGQTLPFNGETHEAKQKNLFDLIYAFRWLNNDCM